MIRLNLTATPQWLDLAPGLRLLAGPLTTAPMVSARADPAIEALPEGATQEEVALAMAKAVAGRGRLVRAELEGIGDAGARGVARLSTETELANILAARHPGPLAHHDFGVKSRA